MQPEPNSWQEAAATAKRLRPFGPPWVSPSTTSNGATWRNGWARPREASRNPVWRLASAFRLVDLGHGRTFDAGDRVGLDLLEGFLLEKGLGQGV